MADACGASRALFLELMVQQLDRDPATGRPRWWDSALADYLNDQPSDTTEYDQNPADGRTSISSTPAATTHR